MNTKHTPGPWSVIEQDVIGSPDPSIGIGSVFPADKSGDGFKYGEVTKANALLIAAAPELLEALVWMVENDETNEGDTPMPDLDGATWNEINAYWINGLNRARAAIAKATGEQA